MKRWLLLLVLVVAGGPAARHAAAQGRDEPPLYDPAQFPRVQAIVDSTYGGHVRVLQVQFAEGFTPGGSRDIPGDAIRRVDAMLNDVGRDQQVVLIGATDPMRFHDMRRKLTHLNNYTLGLARANYLNQLTGNRATVSTAVVLNDRRGVYVVVVEPTDHEGRQMLETAAPAAVAGAAAPELRISPHVSVAYIKAGHMDYTAPQVGLALRKGRWSLYTEYGRTFHDPDDNRIQTAGLRYGQEQGLFFQLAFVDARKLIPWFDQYTSRAVGGTAGLGFAWYPHPLYFDLNGGIGPFDTVTPDRLKDHWEFGFGLGASLGFTF